MPAVLRRRGCGYAAGGRDRHFQPRHLAAAVRLHRKLRWRRTVRITHQRGDKFIVASLRMDSSVGAEVEGASFEVSTRHHDQIGFGGIDVRRVGQSYRYGFGKHDEHFPAAFDDAICLRIGPNGGEHLNRHSLCSGQWWRRHNAHRARESFDSAGIVAAAGKI